MQLLERVSYLFGAIVAAILSCLCFQASKDPDRNRLTRMLCIYFDLYSSLPGVLFKSMANQARLHGVVFSLLTMYLLVEYFFRN
jgi:hypothetical protein